MTDAQQITRVAALAEKHGLELKLDEAGFWYLERLDGTQPISPGIALSLWQIAAWLRGIDGPPPRPFNMVDGEGR